MYTFEDGPHFMESTQHVHIEHEPAERSFEKKPFFLQKKTPWKLTQDNIIIK